MEQNIISSPKYRKLLHRVEMDGVRTINFISLIIGNLLFISFLINSLILKRDVNIFSNATITTALSLYHITLWIFLKKKIFKPLFKYLTTVFHITLISLTVCANPFDNDRGYLSGSMILLLYLIPILLSGFYYRPKVSLLTGAIATGQLFFLFIFSILSKQRIPPDLFLLSMGSIIGSTLIIFGIIKKNRKGANELLTLRHKTIKLQQEQQKETENIDELTQLYNRDHFNKILQDHMDGVILGESFFSLILIDIDYLKSFNESFGTNNGDRVIQAMGSLLKKITRGSDVVARWGGDGFIILCSDTRLNGAFSLACKIKKEFAKIEISNFPSVTFSTGIAEANSEDGKEGLFKRLNKELYRAKEGGRNSINPDLGSENGD